MYTCMCIVQVSKDCQSRLCKCCSLPIKKYSLFRIRLANGEVYWKLPKWLCLLLDSGDVGLPEQAVGGFPLGLGLVVEDRPILNFHVKMHNY